MFKHLIFYFKKYKIFLLISLFCILSVLLINYVNFKYHSKVVLYESKLLDLRITQILTEISYKKRHLELIYFKNLLKKDWYNASSDFGVLFSEPYIRLYGTLKPVHIHEKDIFEQCAPYLIVGLTAVAVVAAVLNMIHGNILEYPIANEWIFGRQLHGYTERIRINSYTKQPYDSFQGQWVNYGPWGQAPTYRLGSNQDGAIPTLIYQ